MAKKRHKPPQQAPNQPRNAPARSDSEKEGSITSQPTDHKTASQVDPKQSLLSNNNARKAAQFITLAALYSSVSQMTLSPVYGSVPAAAYHRYGSLAAALPAFLALSLFRRSIPMSILKILPSFVHWIPSIQFLMFKFSSTLPVPYGPLITESVTYYPLLFLSVCAAGFYFEKVDLRSHSDFFPKQAPPILGYLLFTAIQKTSKKVLTSFMGSNLLFTRLGLQFVLAGFYNIALSAAPIWPCVPALAFTMLGNVHNPLSRTTDVLNNTLALHNFTLLERRESITGYISVLENTDAHFRVMRCDHSLLGGEWTMSPPKGRAPLVREPIYAVFTMLEAVRLIETETGKPRIPDSDSRALNIGLGIGTAPTALIAHGVNTSIVELDPVVYEFALKYFGLPTNHSWTIGDAVPIIANTVDSGVAFKYDYIIHDVFTGGAEPVELFTLEFLSGLHTLLKADGVIAIVSQFQVSLAGAKVAKNSRIMLVISRYPRPHTSSALSAPSFRPAASSVKTNLHLLDRHQLLLVSSPISPTW